MALETGSWAYTISSTVALLIILVFLYTLGEIGGERSITLLIATIVLIGFFMITGVIYIGVGEWPSGFLTTTNFAKRKTAEVDLETCQDELGDRPSQDDVDDLQQQLEDDRTKFEKEKSAMQARSSMLQNQLSSGGVSGQGLVAQR